jgi:antitoxin MazE
MKTAVHKWGKSLAVRIPRAFAAETHLHNGTEIDLKLQSGRLVITSRKKKRHDLRSLLAQVRKSNRHAVMDWGGSVGGETC